MPPPAPEADLPAKPVPIRMTAARSLEDIQSDLVAWGLLESGEGGPVWTRRFRGGVMREAARLAEEERAGRKPEGAPLENAVAGALASFPLPEGATVTREHSRFLYAVELASLPDAVRHLMGA